MTSLDLFFHFSRGIDGRMAQPHVREGRRKSAAPLNFTLDASKRVTMNQNQKRILMAVIAMVIAMLVYPPFQVVVQNGVIFNMGYDWLVDPPKRGYIAATVNVSMLLIQWIGVLVVGGLAFCLAKNLTQEPRVSGSGAIMFGLLRLIRGVCGIVFTIQIYGLFPVITWLQQPEAITESMLAHILIKVLALALFGWLFFWLRNIINRLHIQKHGVLHPTLRKKKWAF